MSKVKKIVTPNADESNGRWYSAVVKDKTFRFQAVDNEEAEKKAEELMKSETETEVVETAEPAPEILEDKEETK